MHRATILPRNPPNTARGRKRLGRDEGDIPCLGKSECPCHFLQMTEQIMQLAKVAPEKQWTVAVMSWWTLDGCCYFLEDFSGVSTSTLVWTPLNATGTLQIRKYNFSTSATFMGNFLSLTKSSGIVQMSKRTA